MPFDNLRKRVVANRGILVAYQIRAVWIEFSSGVAALDVNEALVNEADDLHVVGRAHELNTFEGSCGDETCAAARLRAPGNFLSFSIRNCGVGLYGRPQTEVCAILLLSGLQPSDRVTHHQVR